MDETMIDKAEQLLSYYEQHGADVRVFPVGTAFSEWWMGAAITLLRDMLPEWSAFKTPGGDV